MLSEAVKSFIPEIKHYFKDKPVIRAWIFGSFSRGEEKENSDLDILVDYDNTLGHVSLFAMGGMLMDLCDLLGRKVDLVDNDGLKDFARPGVEKDKVLIYERGC